MPLKTYVLLDHTRPTAKVYIQPSENEKIMLNTRPIDHAFLQVTAYNTKENKNRTLRLKLNSNTIFQDEQIDKEKILANEKFTPREKAAVEFKNGVLNTNNTIVQTFLETSPQFYGSDWVSDGIRPLYKLLDKQTEIKNTNTEFKKRLAVGNMIADLNLKEAQDLMIRLNGSFFTPPVDLEECQNQLVDFMDSSDEKGLEAMLKSDINIDDETTILIGRLINAGMLSFDAVENQVAKKNVNGDWINLKAISNEYPLSERQRYFAEFLTSPDGKILLNDLKSDLKKIDNTNYTEGEKISFIEKGEGEIFSENKPTKKAGRPPKNK